MTLLFLSREVLVKDDIAWPNCLSLDWEAEELYWTDAKFNTIDAVSFDGQKRRKVLKHSGKITLFQQNFIR